MQKRTEYMILQSNGRHTRMCTFKGNCAERRRWRRRSLLAAVLGITQAALWPQVGHADTTATWTAAKNGIWTSTSAWSTHPSFPNNGVPSGTDYTALINVTGAAYTVALNSTVVVDGLNLNSATATISQSSGLFTAGTIALDAGAYQLNGGTIANSTIDLNGGSFTIQNGNLNGVTVSGSAPQIAYGGNLYLQNEPSATTQTFDVSQFGSIYADYAAQTWGNLNINEAGFGDIYPSGPHSSGPQTLTLPSTCIITGGAQFAANMVGDSLVNNGTLNSNGLYPCAIETTTFTNNGIAETSSGNGLDITSPNWSNSSTGTISASGESLFLSGQWSNTGTITASHGANVYLGGSFSSASLAGYSTDATVTTTIEGTLINSSLDLLSHPGTWILGNGNDSGGAIDGGTILGNGSQTLSVQTNGLIFPATLDGVTLNGVSLALGAGQAITIQDGITITNHNFSMGGSLSVCNVKGASQTWNNLDITAGYNSGINAYTNLTLGPQTIVNGNADFSVQTGYELTNNGTLEGGSSGGMIISAPTFINNGLLDAPSGGDVSVFTGDQTASTVNYGTIDCHDGGSIGLSDNSLTNYGTIEAINTFPNGMGISAINFTNYGTILLKNGTISYAKSDNTSITLPIGDGTLAGWGTLKSAVSLSSQSKLSFDIGGTTQGPGYDWLTIDYDVSLGGNLILTLVDGFEPSSSDMFTVLTCDETLSGSFLNVANGGRLMTSDGEGSFEVQYGTGPYINEIVLSDFEAVPEPSTTAVVCALAFGMAMRRRRAPLVL